MKNHTTFGQSSDGFCATRWGWDRPLHAQNIVNSNYNILSWKIYINIFFLMEKIENFHCIKKKFSLLGQLWSVLEGNLEETFV